MKVSVSTSLLVLLGVASGLPIELQDEVVSNSPINLINYPQTDKKCGQNTFTSNEIYNAAQYGINLKLANQFRGKREYPHPFDNDDSKGNILSFPHECPQHDPNRYEYPIKNGGVYDGGKNNVNTGDERIVYYWDGQDTASDGNPQVHYCGIMTHKGAPSGGFLLC